jgi:hypothetical protein
MKILSYQVFNIVIFVYYSQHKLSSLTTLNIVDLGIFIVINILISNHRLMNLNYCLYQ